MTMTSGERQDDEMSWRGSSRLTAEIDRVGVSIAEIGAANGVLVVHHADRVHLFGSATVRPRPKWVGTEELALALLAGLPDDAGVTAFWEVFRQGDDPEAGYEQAGPEEIGPR